MLIEGPLEKKRRKTKNPLREGRLKVLKSPAKIDKATMTKRTAVKKKEEAKTSKKKFPFAGKKGSKRKKEALSRAKEKEKSRDPEGTAAKESRESERKIIGRELRWGRCRGKGGAGCPEKKNKKSRREV